MPKQRRIGWFIVLLVVGIFLAGVFGIFKESHPEISLGGITEAAFAAVLTLIGGRLLNLWPRKTNKPNDP